MSRRPPRARAWSLAIGWLLVIYATIPLVGRIVEASYRYFHPRWYPLIVSVLLAAAAFLAARRLFGLARGAVAAACAHHVSGMRASTILVFRAIDGACRRKIHLIQYGVLAVLFWRAGAAGCARPRRFGGESLSLPGGGHRRRVHQGVLPSRVGGCWTMRVNLYASLLALGFVAVMNRQAIRGRMGATSRGFVASSLLLCVAFLWVFVQSRPVFRLPASLRRPTGLLFAAVVGRVGKIDRDVEAGRLPCLTEQFDAETDQRLAAMDRWLAEGRLSSATHALFRHILLHHEYVRRLMREGRPADAFREHCVHRAVFLNLLWHYPPRWMPEDEARILRLLPPESQEPPFRSAFLPDASPVYRLSLAGDRFIAYAPLPERQVHDILLFDRDLYRSVHALFRNEAAYEAFQREHPVEGEPFLFELRVHLFRRDRYALLGDYRVAWWENEIIRRHFGETVARTPWAWSPETAARVHALAPGLEKDSYTSPVGDGYIYWASRGALQTACLAAAAAIGVFWVLAAKSRNGA
ncbi:hypothetical protein HS125_07150 [bacterium]|nr:hypothetical protein [bacterium]